MRKKTWIRIIFKKLFLLLFLLFLYCEYFVYYVVIFQCNWPVLDHNKKDINITIKQSQNIEPLRAMLLADTHLLGSIKGHWLDKLKREWQMHRAFQAAISIHKPDVVFVLGDLTDEGLWCSKNEFEKYVKRFYSLFSVPEGTEMYVVAGNHDMGFHYGISPYLHERFKSAFNAPSVRLLTLRGNHFILINSMALEGDGCFLCRPVELQLQNIEKALKCAKGEKRHCQRTTKHIQHYSRPIILQHYPLYRESDAKRCEQPDLDRAPEPDYSHVMAERWDCLSKEATWTLLHNFVPRLAIGGHTHHGCYRKHQLKGGFITEEYSIPSFSWRNREDPSFLLAVFTPDNYAISKCHMPREYTVAFIWIVGILAIIAYIVISETSGRKLKWSYLYRILEKKRKI